MLQVSFKDYFQSVLHFLENLFAFFVLFHDGIQEPAAENSNKSDDSPASSETSPTVLADTPINAEEGPQLLT